MIRTEPSAGTAFLFNRQSGELIDTFHNPTPSSGDRFGWKVGVYGESLYISAEFDEDDGSAGTLYFYDGYLPPVPEPPTAALVAA